MKTKINALSAVKRILCMSLALIIAILLYSPITAEAKTKSITLKTQGFTTQTSVANKKATKVSTGSYNVTVKKKKFDCFGFVKFVAPRSKTYTITVSNLKANDGKYACGSVGEMLIDSKHPKYITFVDSARGNYSGKHWIRFGGKNGANKSYKDYPLKSSAKIKLKKGETLYLHYSFTAGYKCTKITSKLNIK